MRMHEILYYIYKTLVFLLHSSFLGQPLEIKLYLYMCTENQNYNEENFLIHVQKYIKIILTVFFPNMMENLMNNYISNLYVV